MSCCPSELYRRTDLLAILKGHWSVWRRIRLRAAESQIEARFPLFPRHRRLDAALR